MPTKYIDRFWFLQFVGVYYWHLLYSPKASAGRVKLGGPNLKHAFGVSNNESDIGYCNLRF